jgi:hypothetical protein
MLSLCTVRVFGSICFASISFESDLYFSQQNSEGISLSQLWGCPVLIQMVSMNWTSAFWMEFGKMSVGQSRR